MHARRLVRQAAVMDLRVGNGVWGDRVFNARVRPITDDECPCLNIHVLDEVADWDAQGMLQRTASLVVEGRVAGGDDIFDQLDDVSAQVEAKIYGETPNLAGLLQMIGPSRTQLELVDTAQGAERRHGIVRVLFPMQYRTAIADPTTIV